MNELLKGVCDSLPDALKEKAKDCKTLDELLALADKAGVELPDELLDSVAGGIILRFVDFDTQKPSGLYVITNENDFDDPTQQWTHSEDEARKIADRRNKLDGWSTDMIDF